MNKILKWFEEHETLLQWISRISVIICIICAIVLGFFACTPTDKPVTANAEEVQNYGGLPLTLTSPSGSPQDVFTLSSDIVGAVGGNSYYTAMGIDITKPLVFVGQFSTGYNNELGNGNSPNPMLFNSFVYAFMDGSLGSYSYNGSYCWISRTGNRAYITFFNEARQPICLNSPYTTSEPSSFLTPRTVDVNSSIYRTTFYNPYIICQYHLIERYVISVDNGAIHSHEYSAPLVECHLYGHDLDDTQYQGYVSAQSGVNIIVDGVSTTPRMQLAWLLPSNSNYELPMPADGFFRSDSLFTVVNVLGFGAVQSHQTAGSGVTVPFNIGDGSACSILNFMNYGTNFNYGEQYKAYRGFGSAYCPYLNYIPYVYSGDFVLSEVLSSVTVYYEWVTVMDGQEFSTYTQADIEPSAFATHGITLDSTTNSLIIDFNTLAPTLDHSTVLIPAYSYNLGFALQFNKPVSSTRIRYRVGGSALSNSSAFASVGYPDFNGFINYGAMSQQDTADYIYYDRSIFGGVGFSSSSSDYATADYTAINGLVFRPQEVYKNGTLTVVPDAIYTRSMRNTSAPCVLTLAFSDNGGNMWSIGYAEGIARGQQDLSEQVNVAYKNGYNAGKLDVGGQTFWLDFLTGVISAPVSALTQGLNVDIMGFNLSSFFWALITLALVGFLIGFIVKLIK